jgi:hypothetical protein
MVIKTGRYGEFLSCSGYPECKNAKPVPLGVPCPKDGGDIVEIRSKKRGSRSFYGCTNYPKCDFKLWQKPVNEPCPLCQHPFLVHGGGQKNPKLLCGRGKGMRLLAPGRRSGRRGGGRRPGARGGSAQPVPPVTTIRSRPLRDHDRHHRRRGASPDPRRRSRSRRGASAVLLLEQKPKASHARAVDGHAVRARVLDSFRGAALANAVGLLKGGDAAPRLAVMAAAEVTRVPAGGALAVDRDRFSALMTEKLRENPLIVIRSELVERLPRGRPLIVATGPLTGDALAADVARAVGQERHSVLRRDRADRERRLHRRDQGLPGLALDKGETEEDRSAYVNAPLDEAQVPRVRRRAPRRAEGRSESFEDVRYFEAVLPIEVMAERGEMTLAFGPMKPVGLTDPRTGRWPFAVVQLRP